MECAVYLRKNDYKFGIAVLGSMRYIIDKVWVKVRRADGSGDKTLVVLKENFDSDKFALFQLHPLDVASKLGLSEDELQKKGFQIRAKIESSGAGSVRQDKCPVINMRYNSKWEWAKGSFNYQSIKGKFTLLFRSKGTLNNVKCSFSKAGGS